MDKISSLKFLYFKFTYFIVASILLVTSQSARTINCNAMNGLIYSDCSSPCGPITCKESGFACAAVCVEGCVCMGVDKCLDRSGVCVSKNSKENGTTFGFGEINNSNGRRIVPPLNDTGF